MKAEMQKVDTATALGMLFGYLTIISIAAFACSFVAKSVFGYHIGFWACFWLIWLVRLIVQVMK